MYHFVAAFRPIYDTYCYRPEPTWYVQSHYQCIGARLERIEVTITKKVQYYLQIFDGICDVQKCESQMLCTRIHYPNPLHLYYLPCYVKDTLLPELALNVGTGHKSRGVKSYIQTSPLYIFHMFLGHFCGEKNCITLNVMAAEEEKNISKIYMHQTLWHLLFFPNKTNSFVITVYTDPIKKIQTLISNSKRVQRLLPRALLPNNY